MREPGPELSPAGAEVPECHREEERGECSFCHTEVQKAAPYRAASDHRHVARQPHRARQEDCSVCHKSLPQISGHGADATRVPGEPPRMQACLSCHEHQADYDAARCQKCHRDLARYQLKPVSAFSHEGNFVKAHARIARGATTGCAQCHEQTFCADCHASTVATKIEIKFPERVGGDFIHRNDFLGRHAVEARLDAAMSALPRPQLLPGLSCGAEPERRRHRPRSPHPGLEHPQLVTVSRHRGAARYRGLRLVSRPGSQHQLHSLSQGRRQRRQSPPISWLQQHSHDEIHRNSMCLYCHL